MEEGYYIPEITEFHPGFVFEIWDRGIDSIWVETIYCGLTIGISNGEFKLTVERLIELIKKEEVRVKLLTKEDIEECGFELYEDDKEIHITIFKKRDLMLLYDFKGMCLILFLNSYNSVYKHSYEEKLFSGIIKNKSKLIDILNITGWNE